MLAHGLHEGQAEEADRHANAAADIGLDAVAMVRGVDWGQLSIG